MFNQFLQGKTSYKPFNTQVYKESKLYLSLFAVTIFSFSIISCSDTVAPGLAPQPYMSLSIGDERQIISFTDSSTILWVVSDTLRRADGRLVYRTDWYYGIDTIAGYSYYHIEDGFFKSTELDTVKDTIYYVIGSEFAEQKLAKTYPYDGEYWHNIFYSAGDTSVSTFTAHYENSKATLAGTFTHCFRIDTDFDASIYYGSRVGYLGSSFSDSIGYSASYLKINGREYGSKVPPKNSSIWWKPAIKDRNDILFGLTH